MFQQGEYNKKIDRVPGEDEDTEKGEHIGGNDADAKN